MQGCLKPNFCPSLEQKFWSRQPRIHTQYSIMVNVVNTTSMMRWHHCTNKIVYFGDGKWCLFSVGDHTGTNAWSRQSGVMKTDEGKTDREERASVLRGEVQADVVCLQDDCTTTAPLVHILWWRCLTHLTLISCNISKMTGKPPLCVVRVS